MRSRNFFTQDSVCKEDKKNYDTLMETISWFFFDLLFLGYVEDCHSGESFHLPRGLSWSIYVEVSVPWYLSMSVLDLFFSKQSATHFYVFLTLYWGKPERAPH